VSWPGADDLPPTPDLDKLVTEDGKPVDNVYVERQYKLLTEPLHTCWDGGGRPFLALANVGWFRTAGEPPLVPDVLLSLDVVPRDPRTKEGRSYFQWLLGKPPNLVLEIVSDTRGGEDGLKMRQYANQGVFFYVIYDPDDHLEQGPLRVFELRGGHYVPIDPSWMEDLKLGLVLWTGTYWGMEQVWLRWCDRQGTVIPTGAERAEEEHRRADEERQHADEQRQRADRLAARLRELGIDPEA
jgi:Uma2 family endonuclease